MLAHALITGLLFIPAAASPTEPAYVYSPCLTSRGRDVADATLEAPAFDEKMKALGYKQRADGKWDADYKVIRTEVFRWVDDYGEAICAVEITSAPR